MRFFEAQGFADLKPERVPDIGYCGTSSLYPSPRALPLLSLHVYALRYDLTRLHTLEWHTSRRVRMFIHCHILKHGLVPIHVHAGRCVPHIEEVDTQTKREN